MRIPVGVSDRYQDYVIKDGEFVGQFELMYERFDDPWHQNEIYGNSLTKILVRDTCRLLLNQGFSTSVEIGCGYGNLSQDLSNLGFNAYAIDMSNTCISRARILNPRPTYFLSDFDNIDLYQKIKPDIFILSEISWYILPRLKSFITKLQKFFPRKILIHELSTYADSQQEYGREYFTDLDGILEFFGLEVLSSATTWDSASGNGTYFSATI